MHDAEAIALLCVTAETPYGSIYGHALLEHSVYYVLVVHCRFVCTCLSEYRVHYP